MAGFSSPPDPDLFKAQVWSVVRQIPAGYVATYGQIASLIPLPYGTDPQTYKAFGARWVGGAMAACPGDVPWQRVINAQGKISLPEGGGRSVQHDLLLADGIQFDSKDKIDLVRYRWAGP